MARAMSERSFAVVTGASSGIGFELAKQFVENGFDLIVTAEDEGIGAAAEELRIHGAAVQGFQADLASPKGVEDLYEAIKAFGRPLDSIAINAGVGVSGAFIDTPLEDELNMIALNIISSVHLAKRVVKGMVRNRRGRILFTSSIAAVMPASFMAVYGASKAFLYSFSEALRNELKDSGVSVTALMPGPTDTQFFKRAYMEDTRLGQMAKDDPATVARQGFEAMMKGKDHVLAGSMKVKVQGSLAEIMPETLKAEHHRKMAEPGSARH